MFKLNQETKTTIGEVFFLALMLFLFAEVIVLDPTVKADPVPNSKIGYTCTTDTDCLEKCMEHGGTLDECNY